MSISYDQFVEYCKRFVQQLQSEKSVKSIPQWKVIACNGVVKWMESNNKSTFLGANHRMNINGMSETILLTILYLIVLYCEIQIPSSVSVSNTLPPFN